MLNHMGTVDIQTDRLQLRRFRLDDAEAMFANWSSDSEICKYMRWQPHKSIYETQDVISKRLKLYDKHDFYLWVIVLKRNNEPIGSIGLFVVNENDLCGDAAYCIGHNFWGLGIASEALKAVLNFAFNSIGFNRIEAYHSKRNMASGRVLEKSGMLYEGCAKQKYRSISGFEDCNMYAVVKEDFIK